MPESWLILSGCRTTLEWLKIELLRQKLSINAEGKTTAEKVSRRKLSLLDLAGELTNVSRACKLKGYSRQQFYEIRCNYQTYGAAGLIDRLPGARGPHPNRVDEAVEVAI